jgi:hypothetical protein
MRDDEEFWYSIWKLVAVTTCILIVSVSGCVAHSKYIVAGMVKNGTDPIMAFCSLGVNSNNDALLCAQAIARK